ncbi:hypothetical protein O0I10_000136 [Lichtheimia ornata]|uniref:Pyrrolo-quinoline quinone repeat domain-containing protein n=1 Tax=Lichtheimia ornata TaxID=688661 RepID=A0AAD7Y505_9FUNG|nr:uncharacterized protein O0I10_000136 [Lichtheimia ornata]KAJ8663861.1 hypothetical protein O0I10_000136 [Lichtheimia ornata]
MMPKYCCLLQKKKDPIDPIDASVDISNILVCATTARLFTVDKRDGSIFWDTKSPIGSSGGIISISFLDQDKVLIGGRGRAACIDIRTSDLLWKQKMPRRWLCNEVGVNVNHPKSPGGDTQEKSHVRQHTMVAATWGRVFAFDTETGDQLWRFNCPEGRLGFPMTLIDDTSLFVGCNTMLYSLDPITGQLRWSTKLANSTFTFSKYITLATFNAGISGGGASSSGQPLIHISDLETKVLLAIRITIMIAIAVAKNAS